ncbi:hypothetical protein KR222_008024, partial [Zaprionus bogoriensis]
SHAQLLDETFECLSRMAQGICQTLARPKDRMAGRSMLDELAKFNKSESIEAKQYARTFLRFYLKVLRYTQINQPLRVYERWYGDACHSGNDPAGGGKDEMHIWLQEGQSYLAMKHFEDGSTIIYSAVANDATAGWVEGGLKKLVD